MNLWKSMEMSGNSAAAAIESCEIEKSILVDIGYINRYYQLHRRNNY